MRIKLVFSVAFALLVSVPAWSARPAPKALPKLVLQNPTPIFLVTTEGQEVTQKIVLKNPTKGSIQIIGIELAAPFSWEQELPLVVPAGKEFELKLFFNHVVDVKKGTSVPVKEYQQELKIVYQVNSRKRTKNSPKKELKILLRAEIKIPGKLTCQKPDLQFYDEETNNPVQFQVLCKNTGLESVEITKVDIQGPDAKDFTASPLQTKSIRKGEEIKVGVSFFPKVSERKRGYNAFLQIQGAAAFATSVEMWVHRALIDWQNSANLQSRKQKRFSRHENGTSMGILVDVASGFLHAPSTWYRNLNEMDPSFYSSHATSNQGFFSGHVGWNFKISFDIGNFGWTPVQLGLSATVGYLPQGIAPFVAGEMRADILARFALGEHRSVGFSAFQLGYSLGYLGNPTNYQNLVNNEVNGSTYIPKSDLHVLMAFTVGPEFFVNLDQWSKISGFQIFIRPAYLGIVNKPPIQSGMSVFLGFRKYFTR